MRLKNPQFLYETVLCTRNRRNSINQLTLQFKQLLFPHTSQSNAVTTPAISHHPGQSAVRLKNKFVDLNIVL